VGRICSEENDIMKTRHLAVILLALSSCLAWSEDVYFQVPITSLPLTEGKLPEPVTPKRYDWRMQETVQPYAVLDGAGEAFVGGEPIRPWNPNGRAYQNSFLMVSAPKGAAPTGRLFVPNGDFSRMVALKFKLEPGSDKPESRQEFFKAKGQYYQELRQRDIPGAAWFRHQEGEAAKALGGKPAATPNQPPFNPRRPRAWEDSYDASYELFSGGRALSENLQLERVLISRETNAALVPITNLNGITVREMDWKALLQPDKPALDPLAAHIPFDQHALFFSSFESMSRWIEEADRDGTPVLQMFEPRAEDANSRGRYQKQLCLELNELSRLLGPKLITSAAFTGSDPYLRTGSDVGVLYESSSAGTLLTLLQARQAAAQVATPAVKLVKGEFAGVSYSGILSEDRAISSYLAALSDVVLISNSRVQLERLIDVAKGKIAALAAQNEYVYFRQKYPKGDTAETGFLVLSDATIRRWCGPQWRIANARRTCAAAALAELQAAHLDQLVNGKVQTGCVATNVAEVGDVFLTTNGVFSPRYGTLNFLTPIIEMPIAEVTKAECDGYNRWRDGYQQNWSGVFDPIAIRFSMSAKQLKAEVSVVPLIAGSEYRQFIAVSTGASIAQGAGDPHPEALVHLAVALNPQSEPIKESGNFLGGINPSFKANPLGWLGQCVALYADQDPFWNELAKAPSSSDFLETNYWRLPIALYCEVKNPLGLTAFLASARAFIEQTAPQMTIWENLDYNGQAYVKVKGSDQVQDESGLTNLSVYYAVTPRSLLLTVSEPVLKRALDRQRAQIANKQTPKSDWLGSNVCFKVDQSFVPILESLFRDQFRPAQQRLAWNNLPILNEWHRRFPQQDPIKLHEQIWDTTLLCPGGGRYVWNEQWQTMESTVYGHPGQPKGGPDKIQPLGNVLSANLGLTFENQGLSAKAVLERKEADSSR
jgi:hypothetical protein